MLEHCSPVWSPCYIGSGNTNKPESVEHSFTLTGMCSLSSTEGSRIRASWAETSSYGSYYSRSRIAVAISEACYILAVLLCPPYAIGQAIILLACDFYLSPSIFFFFSRLISAVRDCMSAMCDLSANLESRSEIGNAGNAGPKKSPKNRYLDSITQLCRAISSQRRHVSTIRKKLVKQQCLPHTCSQHGELRPTSGWELLTSLRHPCKFQRVSRVGSVTARYSSTGR